MDTSRYKRLLSSLVEQLRQTGDSKSAQVACKWLRDSELSMDSFESRSRLSFSAREVRRTANALVAVNRERRPEQTKAGEGIPDLTVIDLLDEADRMISECRRIEELLSDGGLRGIVGKRLVSVTFVMDYLQLGFDEGTLTVTSVLNVAGSDGVLWPRDPGYRDALCSLIATEVSNVEIADRTKIEISFPPDQIICISLRPEDTVGPEAATFSSGIGGFWVW